MMTTAWRRVLGAAVVVGAAAVLGLPGARVATGAQPEQASPADLRRENDQLRERVSALQAQIAERNRRIKQLEDEVKALKEQLTNAPPPPTETTPPTGPGTPAPPAGPGRGTPPTQRPTTPGGPAGPTATLPAEALASPESLFAALAEDFDKSLKSVPLSTDQERRRYLSEASKWARAMERKHRGNVEWIIDVVSATDAGGRTTVEFRVLDPKSLLPYSSGTQSVVLPSRTGKPLAERKDQSKWKLVGMFGAKPTINPDRETSGFFDVPKLIGPFTEFGFDLTVTTLTPAPAP